MWPTWENERLRIALALDTHSRNTCALPGIRDATRLKVLSWQFVASLRREKYYRLLRSRHTSAKHANPHLQSFDAERAVAYHVQVGNTDEASWLIFLMTHFARPEDTGWLRLKHVYGGLNTRVWDWATVSGNPTLFTSWLNRNWRQLGGKFGNHRKYESLNPLSHASTSKVVESYVLWVGNRGHQYLFSSAIQNAGNHPHTIFDFLYNSMRVKRFGRLAKFDYLSLIGRYGIAPIDAGSAYLAGATGPARGARLLFDDDPNSRTPEVRLQTKLDALDSDLQVTMKVIEDALCNWQKTPSRFVHFKG